MMTRDPNRLAMIIRDRELTLRRLAKALADSKEDERGDAFIINRFIKHHKEQLKLLQDEFRQIMKDSKAIEQQRQLQAAKIEQAEVDALRNSLTLWSNQ